VKLEGERRVADESFVKLEGERRVADESGTSWRERKTE
jgi:hypothetical protein